MRRLTFKGQSLSSQAIATPKHRVHILHAYAPLNIGGQVCLCSWTTASALVPTLFLILVAALNTQTQFHASRLTSRSLPNDVTPDIQGASSFNAYQVRPLHFHSTECKYCMPMRHSTLEGKCVCAHGQQPQLWCQHFFSSLWLH